jgi:DNA mismatch repair protein MutS
MRTLRDMLDAALVAEPPLQARDGGFIAPGHNADLDAARTLRDEGRGVIAKLAGRLHRRGRGAIAQDQAQQRAGLLHRNHGDPCGKDAVPAPVERFIHRQTTANAVRFTTLDLSELETRILNAGTRALEIEKMTLFEGLARRGSGRE